MPKGSMVTLGGGWKQFYTQKVDKEDFYKLVEEVLGIKKITLLNFWSRGAPNIIYGL